MLKSVSEAQDAELFKVRERLHRINDVVQVHELKLNEYGIKIDLMAKQVLGLTTQTATREQLDAAVLALGTKVANAVDLMSLQIHNIADDLAPIRKGIYWVITMVLGAVVLAVLAFVLRRPLP